MRTSWVSTASAALTFSLTHVQSAGALPIETEIFRARHRNRDLGKFGAEQAHAEGILGDSGTEPLVSHIDERQEVAALEELEQLAPLRLAQIRTRGVVAGGMQQHHRTRRQLVERAQHASNFSPPVAGSK